jgi:transmembrane sensor
VLPLATPSTVRAAFITFPADMPTSNPQTPEKTRQEASTWLAKLDRGLRDNEGAALRAWLTHPGNRSAILDSARLWHDPGVTAVLAHLFPGSPELEPPQKRPDVLAMSIFAVAAAALSIVTMIGLSDGYLPLNIFRKSTPPPPVIAPTTYATGVGERRDVVLADDSRVTLNTGTAIGVTYTIVSRDIYLRSGEASFHVAQDARRPFSVYAGKRRFEATGTDFNVRVLTPDDIELTVAAGSVRVMYLRPSQETPAQARLRDNVTNDDTTIGALETVLVEPGLAFMRRLDSSDLQAHLAWHQGMIVFRNETVEHAVQEAGRYTAVPFAVPDKSLAEARISGYFRTGDLVAFLNALREDLRVDWQLDSEGRIELVPPPEPPRNLRKRASNSRSDAATPVRRTGQWPRARPA